jgi:hypothetical protein
VPAGDDFAYLLSRALPDALDPILRKVVGTTVPRRGEDGRYLITHAGFFGSRAAADLLAFGRNQRLDGALVVVGEDVTRTLYFRHGSVVGAASDLVFEGVGRTLRRAGLLDEATARVVAEREEGVGLASALRLVTPPVAQWGVETRVWDVAAALFFVTKGHFVLLEGEPDLGEVPLVDLSPMDLAIEGLRRYDEWRHGATGEPMPLRADPVARPPEAPPAPRAASPLEEVIQQLRLLGDAV